MPNTKSAKKRVLVTKAKTENNKMAKSSLRTLLKKADAAIANNAPDKGDIVRLAVKRLDQATAKGLLHKNTASRKKSSLALRVNAVQA